MGFRIEELASIGFEVWSWGEVIVEATRTTLELSCGESNGLERGGSEVEEENDLLCVNLCGSGS